jgi:translation initiation factor 2 alpha subunit (eIF-2alpha)
MKKFINHLKKLIRLYKLDTAKYRNVKRSTKVDKLREQIAKTLGTDSKEYKDLVKLHLKLEDEFFEMYREYKTLSAEVDGPILKKKAKKLLSK